MNATPFGTRGASHASVSTNAQTQVLIVDGDEQFARHTAHYLTSQGLAVSVATDGVRGRDEALRGGYDCVVLDLALPLQGGLDVCRLLRNHTDVPIVIMTKPGDEGHRVLGLDAGADDCVTKPLSSRELLARIRAVVRRVRGRVGPILGTLRVGGLELDSRHLSAAMDGRAIEVTALEFAILWALALRAGQVVSREQLLDSAKGSAELAFDRSIDVHVCRIRSKLRDDTVLKTVRGAGYLLAGHTSRSRELEQVIRAGTK